MLMENVFYFVVIVRKKTYSEAAEVLNLSQSSLSKKIVKLENDLGVKLFDRSKKYISLTPAGKIFYRSSLELLDICENIESEISIYRDSHYNVIKLGFAPIVSYYNIVSILKLFIDKHDNIKLDLKEVKDSQLILDITSGYYDVGISFESSIEKSIFSFYPLFQDKIVLVVCKNHPLAHNNLVSLSELKNEMFIFNNEYEGACRLCEKACREANFIPKIKMKGEVKTCLSMVEANMGVSLLFLGQINMFNIDNIAIISLKENITDTMGLFRLVDKKLNNNEKLLLAWLKRLCVK